MKLQNLTVIFIIIVLPIILLVSLYISTGLKTIKYQALYDTGLITATQDAIQAFEINTLKNKYSANAEVKRSAIKASVKMLEKGLCNTCNISSYNTDEIEEYIPAILFGMNNGFYLYYPSYNPTTYKYEHSLKNYVYYSEQLEGKSEKDYGIVIIYHLDSYVEVSGYFDQNYEFGEGYLINIDEVKFKKSTDSAEDAGETRTVEDFYKEYEKALEEGYSLDAYEITYYGTEIDVADELAVNYFVDNYKFSKWFKDTVIEGIDFRNNDYNYLKVSRENDPEDPESAFSMHKKEVIRNKIQNVLNSSITAYSKRTYGQEYKMPKLSEEDWEKIYTDISVITFFQGKKIGFTKYNGYCVLNSNNHYELINPNLLYFSTDDNGDKYINTTNDYYHDIRCSKLNELSSIEIEQELGYELPTISTIRGWKIGRFQRKTITKTDVTGDEEDFYIYERNELGCYECINGSVNSGTSVYDYIAVAEPSSHKGNTTNGFIKESYWTSLARERAKLHEDKEIPSDISVYKEVKLATDDDSKYSTSAIARNGETVTYKITIENNAKKTDTINILDEFDVDKIKDIKITSIKSGETISYNSEKTDLTDESGGKKGIQLNSVSIPQEARLEIIYNAKVFGTVGESIQNTVNIYPSSGGDSLGKAEATVIIRGSDITVEKVIDGKKDKTVKYGQTETYTVTIKNNLTYAEEIDIIDEIPEGIEILSIPTVNGVEGKREGNKIRWKDVVLNGTITIEYNAKIEGNIGETLINTVYVYVPSDETTIIKQASASSKITATIKTKRGSGKDFHVILVLDHSGSMSGNIEKVRDSANEIIETVGKDKVTIVSFAQGTSELKSIENYILIGDGVSTNYLGALVKTEGILNRKELGNLNNYVVFMSDGGPTNTQSAVGEDKYEDEDKRNFLETLIKIFGKILEKIITIILSPTYGGWLELDWTGVNEKGNNTYGFRLLVTGNIFYDLGESGGVAKSVWQNIIMPEVSEIKSKSNLRDMYTVYFDTGAGEKPIYGLAQMATDDTSGREESYDTYGKNFYYGNSATIKNEFAKIAKDIAEKEKEDSIELEGSTCTITKINDVHEIKIGDKKYSGDKVIETIKDKGESIDENTYKFNVNDICIDGEYIFKTSEDITIIYK